MQRAASPGFAEDGKAARGMDIKHVLEVLEVLIEPNIAQRHALHVERTAEKAFMLSDRV
jgi:hypothetical protein